MGWETTVNVEELENEVVLRDAYDNRGFEVLVNGFFAGVVDYDTFGWGGIEAAEALVQQISIRLGVPCIKIK